MGRGVLTWSRLRLFFEKAQFYSVIVVLTSFSALLLDWQGVFDNAASGSAPMHSLAVAFAAAAFSGGAMAVAYVVFAFRVPPSITEFVHVDSYVDSRAAALGQWRRMDDDERQSALEQGWVNTFLDMDKNAGIMRWFIGALICLAVAALALSAFLLIKAVFGILVLEVGNAGSAHGQAVD